MRFLTKALLPATVATFLTLSTPYASESPPNSSRANYSPHQENETLELQYVRNGENNSNSALFTYRDSRGRKKGITEINDDEKLRFVAAYRQGFGKFEAKLFGGREIYDTKDNRISQKGNNMAGARLRFTHPFIDETRHGMVEGRLVEARAEAGHERTFIDSKGVNATSGYGRLRIEDILPVDIDLLAGTGHVHEFPDSSRTPYGVDVIFGKGKYGIGFGLTENGGKKSTTTRNFAVFRYAGYDGNKWPAFFALVRDTPSEKKSFQLVGLYYGPGIDGSWQLINYATYGIAEGMFTRTVAHPDQNLGKLERFTDVGNFSRDSEDATIQAYGANLEQDIGDGLRLVVREIDLHGTLYKKYGPVSNPHLGFAAGETTTPSYDHPTHSMKNKTTKTKHIMTSANLLDDFFERRGLRLGIFSDISFTGGKTANTCGLYLSGIRF